jgi:tetratricopeptide (TPR) repeat protein
MGRLSVVWIALVLLIPGCGSNELWIRWRAERLLWRATRFESRARNADPASASAATDRALRALAQVSERYPARRWVPRAARGDTLARDIARVSGQAGLLAGGLEVRRERYPAAVAIFDRVARDYEPVWPTAFEARLAMADAIEISGDTLGAIPAWEAAARLGRVVDPDSDRVSERSFAAAARVLAFHRDARRSASADSLVATLTEATDRELSVHARDSLAAPLWIQRAMLHATRGTTKSDSIARSSLFRALTHRFGAPFAREAMMALGEDDLEDGAPDSAIVWARRAEAISVPWELGEAIDLETRGWEASGQLDSAAVALDRLAGTRHLPVGVGTLARYREALLLEQTGKWELARTAYHSVIASDPISPHSFDAMERLVRHHAGVEPDMAEGEARWGFDQIRRTLDTVRDPGVRARARLAQARMLAMIGDSQGALDAYQSLWNDAPGLPEGVTAAFEAAELAAHLNDRGRAVSLLEELALRATTEIDRDRARKAAQALVSPTR